jgi:hypothetical protein
MPCRLQYCTCWASQERSGANERSLTAMGQAASPAAVSFAGNSRSLSHLEMNRAWINLASYLERTRRQVLCFCPAGSRRSWLCYCTARVLSPPAPSDLCLSASRATDARPVALCSQDTATDLGSSCQRPSASPPPTVRALSRSTLHRTDRPLSAPGSSPVDTPSVPEPCNPSTIQHGDSRCSGAVLGRSDRLEV